MLLIWRDKITAVQQKKNQLAENDFDDFDVFWQLKFADQSMPLYSSFR